MSCPAPDRVLDYLARTLDAGERDDIDGHVDTCDACRALFVELAIDGDADGDIAMGRVDEPATIGRYQVTARLGDGGMGTVYAAYDPKLDRKVAVKLVHPELAARGGLERLLREGRALARLSHPNVVTVYDADTDGDRVYVAMELVDGETLAGWLHRPRSWHDIAGKLVEVGRGIAAAHRAGIVHRDVKPENVLVDRLGHAKVADFGLAGHSEGHAMDGSTAPVSPASRLTMPGTVMGTPMFMSPEQKAGRVVGPPTDQYSLCAALADALAGMRVPGWLQHAIARGMAQSPSDRFASMDELVDAIDPERRSRAHRRIVLAAAAVVAIAGGVAGYAVTRGDAVDDACDRAKADEAALWAPHRDRVIAAFQAVGAGELVSRLDRAMTVELLAQSLAHDKLCERKPNTPEARRLFELGMQCLAERHADVRAVVADLEHITRDQVRGTLPRIHSLPATDECWNAESLRAEAVASASADARKVRAQIREDVEAARVLVDDTRVAEARDRAHRAIARARTFGGVILARTLVDVSQVQALVDGFPALERSMREALMLAEASQADVIRARAFAELMAALAREPGREREALAMRPLVEGAVARAGGTHAYGAMIAQAAGIAYFRLGNIDEALVHLTKALDLARGALPAGDPRLPEYIYTVGVALNAARRDAEAAKLHAEAYAVASEVWGPDHPSAVRFQVNLATVHGALGDCATALREAEHARAIMLAALPKHAPENLQLAEIIGTCYGYQHRHDDAFASTAGGKTCCARSAAASRRRWPARGSTSATSRWIAGTWAMRSTTTRRPSPCSRASSGPPTPGSRCRSRTWASPRPRRSIQTGRSPR